MTPIEQFLIHHPKLPALDLLQGEGIVSDRCITISDIHKDDQSRAVRWLVEYVRKQKEREV